MLYSGDGDDINDASYKLSKLALRNTPSKSPKEYKTAEEREAQKNEGKVASIINLVDEIDTTIYLISDKLDDQPNFTLVGGVFTKLDMDKLKELGVKQNANVLGGVDKETLAIEAADKNVLDGLPPKPTINDYKKALEPFAEEIVNRYNRNVDLRNDIIIKGYVRGKTPQIVPPATPERRQPQPTLPSVIGRKTNRNYDEEEPADMETPIRQLFDDVGNVEENDNESDEEENDEGNNPPGPSPGQQEADDTVQLIQETLQQPGGGGDGNNITLGKDYF